MPLRLRVVPPQATGAPPFEKGLVIDGGANVDLGVVGIDRGSVVTPRVSGPGGGVPAYVRFARNAAPGTVVEGFADSAIPLHLRVPDRRLEIVYAARRAGDLT